MYSRNKLDIKTLLPRRLNLEVEALAVEGKQFTFTRSDVVRQLGYLLPRGQDESEADQYSILEYKTGKHPSFLLLNSFR